MPTNFIFILADDLGYADLGCYGGRAPVSPNIDRMAAEGVRFTRGYANSAVCSPTRFALATGRYQYRIRGAAEEPIGSAMRGDKVIGQAAWARSDVGSAIAVAPSATILRRVKSATVASLFR